MKTDYKWETNLDSLKLYQEMYVITAVPSFAKCCSKRLYMQLLCTKAWGDNAAFTLFLVRHYKRFTKSLEIVKQRLWLVTSMITVVSKVVVSCHFVFTLYCFLAICFTQSSSSARIIAQNPLSTENLSFQSLFSIVYASVIFGYTLQ